MNENEAYKSADLWIDNVSIAIKYSPALRCTFIAIIDQATAEGEVVKTITIHGAPESLRYFERT